MRHMNALLRVMSDPECDVFPQIKLILIHRSQWWLLKFQIENLSHANSALRTLEKYHHEYFWHMIHKHHQSQNIFRRDTHFFS